jgi:hypothetical protein
MRKAATVALGALAALALASVALAAVEVYSNDFKSKAEFKQARVAGKGCDKGWSRKQERLDVESKGGPARCKLKLPVQGDAAQPDHELEVTAKVDKSTPKSVRKQVYVAVSVREGKESRYELRVFPHRQRYDLRREPDDNAFPERGEDKAIGRIGERNRIRVQAFEGRIQASVNKKKIGPVEDPAAGDLRGTRMSATLGVEGRTGKDVAAWFDDVKVRIPNP